MYNPKVSIIIPVYNGSNYLAEAIDSALSQTYKNIEIIVVNDGSNDNRETEKIALSYGDKIKYIEKRNGGSSSALNTGIKNMTGEYFSWLSHDDLYTEKKIEKSVKMIDPEKRFKQVIICGCGLIDSCGNAIFHPKKEVNGELDSIQMLKKLSKDYNFNGCSVLLPKTIIDEVGFFDENLVYVNDADYWYRLILHGCLFTCFTEHFVKSRVHNGQVSVKKANLFDEERKNLEKKVFNSFLKKENVGLKMIRIFMNYTLLHGDIEIAKDIICILKSRGIKCGWFYWHMLSYFYGKILSTIKKCYKRIFFRR